MYPVWPIHFHASLLHGRPRQPYIFQNSQQTIPEPDLAQHSFFLPEEHQCSKLRTQTGQRCYCNRSVSKPGPILWYSWSVVHSGWRRIYRCKSTFPYPTCIGGDGRTHLELKNYWWTITSIQNRRG